MEIFTLETSSTTMRLGSLTGEVSYTFFSLYAHFAYAYIHTYIHTYIYMFMRRS